MWSSRGLLLPLLNNLISLKRFTVMKIPRDLFLVKTDLLSVSVSPCTLPTSLMLSVVTHFMAQGTVFIVKLHWFVELESNDFSNGISGFTGVNQRPMRLSNQRRNNRLPFIKENGLCIFTRIQIKGTQQGQFTRWYGIGHEQVLMLLVDSSLVSYAPVLSVVMQRSSPWRY